MQPNTTALPYSSASPFLSASSGWAGTGGFTLAHRHVLASQATLLRPNLQTPPLRALSSSVSKNTGWNFGDLITYPVTIQGSHSTSEAQTTRTLPLLARQKLVQAPKRRVNLSAQKTTTPTPANNSLSRMAVDISSPRPPTRASFSVRMLSPS